MSKADNAIFPNNAYCPYKELASTVLCQAVGDLKDLRGIRRRHRDSAYYFFTGKDNLALSFWCDVLGVSPRVVVEGTQKHVDRYIKDQAKAMRRVNGRHSRRNA